MATTWTLQAPMGQLELAGGASIVFEAVNPTTGAQLTGVTVTNVVIYGGQISDGDGLLDGTPLYALEGADRFGGGV